MSDTRTLPTTWRRLIVLLSLLAPLLATAETQPLADPMRPPQPTPATNAAKAKAPQHYHLSSILIAAERRSAIINGRRVAVGEVVDGARVLGIQGKQVTLSIAGRHKTLSLLPLSIKKPVEASR
ncbi:MAG: hypothetical protein ACQETD_03930 [Pseudomonadota bacterium]